MVNDIPGKVIWRARRGILELDIVLNRFIHQCYSQLNSDDKQHLVQLLECTDSELYGWIINHNSKQPSCFNHLIYLIHNRPEV